jgi:hypothetical protein
VEAWQMRQDSSKARERILQEQMSVHEQALKNEHGMARLQAKSAKEKLNLESYKTRDCQVGFKVTNLANEKLKASPVEALRTLIIGIFFSDLSDLSDLYLIYTTDLTKWTFCLLSEPK